MPKQGEVLVGKSGQTTLVYTVWGTPKRLEYYSPVTLQFVEYPAKFGESEQALDLRFQAEFCTETSSVVYLSRTDFLKRKQRAERLKKEGR